MNYKIGQKLVCVVSTWYDGYVETYGPTKGEIVTVEGYSEDSGLYLEGYNVIAIDGTRGGYNPTGFRPLINISAVDELINIQTVKETSDYPIQIPETV